MPAMIGAAKDVPPAPDQLSGIGALYSWLRRWRYQTSKICNSGPTRHSQRTEKHPGRSRTPSLGFPKLLSAACHEGLAQPWHVPLTIPVPRGRSRRTATGAAAPCSRC